MSLCEHYVLCQFGYGSGGSPRHIAYDSWDQSRGDRRGTFTQAQHVAAVASCIARGWVAVLTRPDARREKERRCTSVLPELRYGGVWPDRLKFTQVGVDAHRAIVRAIHGDAHITRNDSGWNHIPELCCFEILAPTRGECERRVAELIAQSDDHTGPRFDDFVGGPAVVDTVSVPEAIGAWRPCALVLRETGYRCVVTYRTLGGG